MKREIKIYQLITNTGYLFMDYDFAKNHNFDLNDYRLVYESTQDLDSTDLVVLERLFEEFNLRKPVDFEGHALSVSDIVKLDDKKYYCDDFGWQEID